ncbi:ABC transporter ATP-binding protein [Pseudaeromonas sp. ZJS20]|uniref:ABC transporter ATP-binding protein n=1 Tax=Pseudaeromonas aegiceratis TaxID=3153928 RepID=UPI00390C83EE
MDTRGSGYKSILDLVNVERSFEGFQAVKSVNLRIKQNEFFTIVGPSGSGKTTMLKMLAGMDQPTRGDIVLNGQSINSLAADQRPTCMVFQFLALFPHMTVGQNIEFPMKMRGESPEQRQETAHRLMAMVRLPEDYYGKSVMKCSGGERQRVAIARAFAYDPEILLFDEPLSAIDAKLRKTLQKELKELHRQSGKTFIYITHSLEEAMFMSDRIGVMCRGELVQVGTPEDIYMRPRNRFVAEFMGDTNIFDVRALPGGGWESKALPGVSLTLVPKDKELEGFVMVRPERMQVVLPDGPMPDNVIDCQVQDKFEMGARDQYELVFQHHPISLELPHGSLSEVTIGSTLRLGWNAADAVFVTE